MFVEQEILVRTYDIDVLGHVSNIVYHRWLEDLRLELLSRHCPLPELIASGYAPVLSRTEIDYLRPVRYTDRPTGRVWLSEVGHARVVLGAEILVDGAVAARARQTGVFVELETGRPKRMPRPVRQRLLPLIHAPSPPNASPSPETSTDDR